MIRPTIRYLTSLYGHERTKEIVESLGMPMDYLSYHDSPINALFAVDLLAELKRLTKDPKAPYYAQSQGGNIECMGAVFYLIAQFCSVRKCYEVFAKHLNKFDQINKYTISNVTDSSLTLKYEPHDLETVLKHFPTPDGVYSAQGWFSAIPNIKGLPHALVQEKASIYGCKANPVPQRYGILEVKWVNSISEGAALHGINR